MDNDLSNLAKSLVGGNDGGKLSLENVARLLSGENGKKVLSALLSDGGERVRRAAEAAKRGDTTGVSDIIKSISGTPEGSAILEEIKSGDGRG
jgi:hypothetical protein